MATEKKRRRGQVFSDGRRIDAALRAAARRAVLVHERGNVPVVVWRDGKTALVHPAEVKRALRIGKK